jgi:hypothetical protein
MQKMKNENMRYIRMKEQKITNRTRKMGKNQYNIFISTKDFFTTTI